ncbi:VIN3-like protein 2 [Senna tora]|uniref:VIN3-like protein 2 n=1 Tax=Senna tora TaxID=362788 RepID=A0A834SM88_9FABA|nr:VIN3-like protein 2 [Senna tora]
MGFEDVIATSSSTNNNTTNIIPHSDDPQIIDDNNNINPKDDEDEEGKLGFLMRRQSHKNKSKSKKKKRNSRKKLQDHHHKAITSEEDEEFEECVKVVEWLECEGHMEKSFKQKFVNWLKMKARAHEVKIVKVYINTFHDDPVSLAEQLVHTFSEFITSCKRKRVVPAELLLSVGLKRTMPLPTL